MKRDLKIIGTNIRNLRISQNLSQEDLAQKCQLHRTYIGAVERGEKNITALSALRISRALNVNITEIFKNVR